MSMLWPRSNWPCSFIRRCPLPSLNVSICFYCWSMMPPYQTMLLSLQVEENCLNSMCNHCEIKDLVFWIDPFYSTCLNKFSKTKLQHGIYDKRWLTGPVIHHVCICKQKLSNIFSYSIPKVGGSVSIVKSVAVHAKYPSTLHPVSVFPWEQFVGAALHPLMP